jgi:hypothetical protein
MKSQTIDPKRFYSLGEIVREGIIPGVDTIPKASRLIHTDALTNKVLRAQRLPRGEFGVQYKVRGSNIISYLAQRDDV